VPGAGGRKAVYAGSGGLGETLTKWMMVVSLAVQRRRLSAEGDIAACRRVGVWVRGSAGETGMKQLFAKAGMQCCFDWSLSSPLVRVARRRVYSWPAPTTGLHGLFWEGQ
jgi:hypothetical protein